MTKTSNSRVISIYRIARFFIFICVFGLFATLAAFQKAAYDSDGVFFHLFYEDIFHHGGNFFAWKLGPGMSLNLELLMRCVAALLSKNNIAVSAIIDTFLQAVLLFFAMNFLFQELVRPNGATPKGKNNHPYLFGLFFISLACMYSGVALTGIFNYYIPSDITLSFLTIAFFIKFYNTILVRYLLIFSTILCLAVFGSRKFFFFFAIPLLVLLLLFLLLAPNGHQNKKVFTKSFISALVAILVADQILLKIISPNFAGAISYLGTPTNFLSKINNFIEELRYLFEQGGYFHVIAVLIFLGAFFFLFYHALKLSFSLSTFFTHINPNEERNIDFLYAFLVILIMIVAWTAILATFIFTSFTPSKEIRYYSVFRYYSIAYVWLLFFVTFKMSQTRSFSPNFFFKLNCSGFLIVFIILIAFYFKQDQLKGCQVPLRSVIGYDASVAEMENARCVDENKEKYNLGQGIANFWLAQSVTALSKKGIWVNQVGYRTDLLPYYWQNSKEWFLKSVLGSGEPHYNFIILSKIDPLAREREIRIKFGKETTSFKCSETSSINKVLVYSDDSRFDERMKHFWMHSPNSIFYQKGRREWLFYATELEINRAIFNMLEFGDTALSTIVNITPKGLLTYGPYLQDLKKGTYQIILNYSINKISPGEPALKWDILVNMEDVIAEGDLVMEEESAQNFIYQFPLKENADLFEFRTYLNNSKAKVTLTSLELNRISNDLKKNMQ